MIDTTPNKEDGSEDQIRLGEEGWHDRYYCIKFAPENDDDVDASQTPPNPEKKEEKTDDILMLVMPVMLAN